MNETSTTAPITCSTLPVALGISSLSNVHGLHRQDAKTAKKGENLADGPAEGSGESETPGDGNRRTPVGR